MISPPGRRGRAGSPRRARARARAGNDIDGASLGHVIDYAEARSIIAGLLEGLPAGSYLAINDSSNTSEALEDALRTYEASGAVAYRTRSLEEFTGYFDGLELVEPGVVLVEDWRPDPGVARGPEIPQVGAVGRKV